MSEMRLVRLSESDCAIFSDRLSFERMLRIFFLKVLTDSGRLGPAARSFASAFFKIFKNLSLRCASAAKAWAKYAFSCWSCDCCIVHKVGLADENGPALYVDIISAL